MISNLENADAYINKAIGENIAALRARAGVSRRELAHLMGISYQQLYKYERGQNKISAEYIVRLKFHLDADYNEFFAELF